MATTNPVLLVDDDAVSRRVIEHTLSSGGFQVVSIAGGQAALDWMEHGKPSVVLLDLMMPPPDGFAVLEAVRARQDLREVPVVVLTALDSDLEIERIFATGADDYVHKPFRPAELLARIRGQVRLREYVEQLRNRERDAQTILELTQALASSLDIRDILYTVVRRVADFARVDRCSIVLVRDGTGYVVASSDDEHLRDLPIDLGKYPELREVFATGEPLVIRDASRHPLLEAVRDTSFHYAALAVVPMVHEGRTLGALFLRSRTPVALADHEVSLAHTVANATAIALNNARILQSLRAETEQSVVAREEAERRVRLFQRYADFFESAADGMAVMDGAGRLLFVNPRARAITGYAERELLQRDLFGLALPADHAVVRELLRGFSQGVYAQGVLLRVVRRDGEVITVEGSFGSVLREGDALLFTFRDVTEEHRTKAELEQTKEFLERVIDSSVDGIVSADLSGRVLLFNRAASRMFGYSREEVVGKLDVERLYPPGVAREIMRKIRDPEVDGPGRLEQYQVDMVTRSGQLLPTRLSAALIYDAGTPVGSVGIFTDMRERIAMEASLSRAQEELRNRERQAIVAELAGAAAHELNQPLTSVIGYAEVLRRKLEPGSPLAAAADVIMSEAERMAEIVRKVGKITRYETKSYVGTARILDLEKSSEESGEESRR